MSIATRSLLATVALSLAAAGLGCSGGLPEAIKDPMLTLPAGVHAVLIVDLAAVRPLQNFAEFEDFLRNRDDNRAYRDRLPFDYQEFVERARVDPLRSVDQVIIAFYRTGWVAVLNGQFDAAHLIAQARAVDRIESQSQRGGTEELDAYPVITLRDSPLRWIEGLLQELAGDPTFAAFIPSDFVSDTVRGTGPWIEAWPSPHLWLLSNEPRLMSAALDLWDGVPGEDLHTDRAFSALFEARPRASAVWLGLPGVGTQGGFETLQIELDVRSYFSPRVTLGYASSDDVETESPGVERRVNGLSERFTGLEARLNNPLGPDMMTRSLDRLGLVEILTAAGPSLRATPIPNAKVIEVSLDIELDQFKDLFANLANLAYR